MVYQLFPTSDAERAHTETLGQQRGSEIARLADGGAIIVWAEQQDPDSAYGYDIVTQRYDAQGNRLGDKVLVYSGPADISGGDFLPMIAGLEGGGYAVSFRDPTTKGLQVSTFDAQGVQIGSQVVHLPNHQISETRSVEVYTLSTGYGRSTITELADGGFAVTWGAGYTGILAQYGGSDTDYSAIFDANGVMTTAPFQVTPWIGKISYGWDLYNYTFGSTALENGNYVIVTRIGTTTPGNDSGYPSVGIQIRGPEGQLISGPFLAASSIEEDMSAAAVATLEDGSFVVVWNTETATVWRQFAEDGVPMGTESSLGYLYHRPTVSPMEDGGFMIGVQSRPGYNPSWRAYAFRFDAEGEQVGEPQQISARNEFNVLYQELTPEFVTLGDGSLMASWNAVSWEDQYPDVMVRSYMAERIGTDTDDVLTGADAATAFFAGAGNDRLTGSTAEDVLDAGTGADTLDGGAGNDSLTGGSGADTVVLRTGMGADRISDFVVGEDTLDFSNLTSAERAAVTFGADGSGDRQVRLGDGSTLTMTGVARNFAATGAVTIQGTASEDATLTANTSTVADQDGLGTIAFQWLRGGVEIAGATNGSYVLTQADVGQQMSVRIDYTDGFGTAETLTSAATTAVTNVNDPVTGAVTIQGTARTGETLSANTATLADEDGLGAFSFQWLRAGAAISGATQSTYELTSADVGATVSLRVSYTDGQGTAEAVTSAPTAAVEAGALTLVGTPGADRLIGGPGNDTISGLDGPDTLNGLGGDDFIYGGSSAADLRDVIYGGDGNDTIDGGFGNDELNGGAGNDTINGGFGSDTLIGNDGDDIFLGAGGSDLIFGNDGNDFVNGGFGYDRVNGGAGADTFFHVGVADHGSDWIQDYNAAEGDVLLTAIAGATRSQFQVNIANTPGAGDAGVAEAFVIYRPTGQILYALVDGAGQDSINLSIGGQVFDLL
ncbi:calcium-binding protein [Pseudotabrizicola sp. L79]|uniref:calcium-binding protein n=1 Tax=Pseudotabrizicola sp. L79 TaxID=3118402 RepID=UPI002F93AD3A